MNAVLSKNRVYTVHVQYNGFHILSESYSRPSVKPLLSLPLSATEARNFTLECCAMYQKYTLRDCMAGRIAGIGKENRSGERSVLHVED